MQELEVSGGVSAVEATPFAEAAPVVTDAEGAAPDSEVAKPESHIPLGIMGKRLKELTPSEVKTYQNLRQIKSRDKKKARTNAVNFKVTASNVDISKKEALDILAGRITNAHVREVAYELAQEACEENGIPCNRYLLAHGLQKTLESRKTKSEQHLEIDTPEIIRSEVIFKSDLHALWDYGLSWREDISFPDYIDVRRKLKSDWMELAPFIDGREFSEKPHREWQQFLPVFDPDLRPNYSQREENDWLRLQKGVTSTEDARSYLLLASRNSYKTSSALCFLSCAILCAPSIRILAVSETTKLSRSFIKSLRGIFEVGSEKTRFQIYFPEFSIPMGDGKAQSYECPMRHLRLPQDTVSLSSLESVAAGGRYAIMWADDIISNVNSQNVEQRLKATETFDATTKLGEVGSSIVIVTGTSWVIGDTYWELIRRNDAALPREKLYNVLVQPAWRVLPGRNRPIAELQESDVELSFPSRLTWAFLRKEWRTNERLFETQNLLIYKDEFADIRCTFERETLDKAVRSVSAFSLAKRTFRVVSVDTAHSQNKTADFSCLVCMDFIQQPNEVTGVLEDLCFVRDAILRRMKTSDLAVEICDFCHQHKTTDLRVVIERSGDWQALHECLQRSHMLRGRVMPSIYWKPLANVHRGGGGGGVLAKTSRVKNTLEPLLAEGKLFFNSGIAQLNECFEQVVNFDGVHRSGSTSSRKDDFVDAVCVGLQVFYPRTQAAEAQPDEALLEYENQTRIAQHLAMQHERVFGGTSFAPQAYQPDNLDSAPAARHALLNPLRQFGYTRRAA